MPGISNCFKIGEKIGFLYEQGFGTVSEIKDKGFYVIIDDLGFVRTCRENELVKLHGTEYHLPDEEALRINEDDSFSKAKHVIIRETTSRDKKGNDIWEIDLHIDALLESHRGMSNAEILNLQMKEFRSFFSKAKSKRIRKLIVIHGVGEGVLKQEVRTYLSKTDGIKMYDADYLEYGKGATAIEINYNIH